jgi:hypothetical protein
VLLASTMISAQDTIVELQKEKVKLLKENRDELRRSVAELGAGDPQELDDAGLKLIEAQLELAKLEGDTKKVIAIYRELAVQAEERVKYLKRQVEKGTLGQREVEKATAELIGHKLELAALEGNPQAAVSLHKELIIQAEEALTYAKRQMEKGTVPMIEVRKAQVELIDRKVGLAKAEAATDTVKK